MQHGTGRELVRETIENAVAVLERYSPDMYDDVKAALRGALLVLKQGTDLDERGAYGPDYPTPGRDDDAALARRERDLDNYLDSRDPFDTLHEDPWVRAGWVEHRTENDELLPGHTLGDACDEGDEYTKDNTYDLPREGE